MSWHDTEMAISIRHRARWELWVLGLGLIASIGLISLHPFEGWRWPSSNPLGFLWAPLPRYRTRFDLWANFLAYVPLGLTRAAILGHRGGRRGVLRAMAMAVGLAAALSFSMEFTQAFLPNRRPQWLDLALNCLGALVGSLMWLLGLRAARPRPDRGARHVWGSGPISLAGATVLTLLWIFAQAANTGPWLAFGGLMPEVVGWRPFAPSTSMSGPLTEAERVLTEASLVFCALLGLAIHIRLGLAGRNNEWLARLSESWPWMVGLSIGLGLIARFCWIWAFSKEPIGTEEFASQIEAWLSPGVQAGLLFTALGGAAVSFLGPARLCILGLVLAGVLAALSSGLPLTHSGGPGEPLLIAPRGEWANLKGLASWAADLWPFASAAWLALWLSRTHLIRGLGARRPSRLKL